MLCSVVLHALLLWVGSGQRLNVTDSSALAPRPLQAQLMRPADALADTPTLLKNTLAADPPGSARAPESAVPLRPLPAAQRPVSPVGPAATAPSGTAPRRPAPSPLAQAQQALARHVYYPEEALERGLQGEVRVLLLLDERGAIRRATLASSSGHALLDQAALAAVATLGRLPGLGVQELILPVEFRLQE